MSKALCILGMVAAALLVLLFGMDIATQWPFGGIGMVVNILFIILALVLGFLSWETWREQLK